MKKKSSIEREKENLLRKKETADARWNSLMQSLKEGKKVDKFAIAHAMNECNWADYGLMMRGYNIPS
jgi:hypothetical protein